MSENNQDDTTINVSWHDFHRVLIFLGYRQIPNHITGKLTYLNEQENLRFLLMRENGYNLDYFHLLLRRLNITPQMFSDIAFRGRHGVE